MTVHTAPLGQIAGSVLTDLEVYLDIITPTEYTRPLNVLSGSTIGQHTRHILEFFQCMIEQAAVTSEPVINYAKRRRNLQIETDPTIAHKYLCKILESLGGLDILNTCKLDCSEHTASQLMVSSTIGRELVYTIEHAIHHLAIVKIALQEVLPDLKLPEHFGVAPSTILHRQEACAQ